MKTKEQIQERINKLEKKLALTAKHYDKYVELYKKSLNSSKLRDIFYQRSGRYKSKYIELYEIWREMIYYKKGLEWTLISEGEVENEGQV